MSFKSIIPKLASRNSAFVSHRFASVRYYTGREGSQGTQPQNTPAPESDTPGDEVLDTIAKLPRFGYPLPMQEVSLPQRTEEESKPLQPPNIDSPQYRTILNRLLSDTFSRPLAQFKSEDGKDKEIFENSLAVLRAGIEVLQQREKECVKWLEDKEKYEMERERQFELEEAESISWVRDNF